MRELVLAICVLGVSMASLSCNDDSGSNDLCGFQCVDGATLCAEDGKTQLVCRRGVDGCMTLEHSKVCDNGCRLDGSCIDGVCGESCDVGAIACDGNVLKKCVSDAATGCTKFETTVCEGGCLDGACVSDKPECQDACNEGEANVCDGKSLKSCVRNSSTGCTEYKLTPCPNGCADGACICSPECSEGPYACFGKTLKQCRTDAAGCGYYETVKRCTYCNKDIGKCTEDLQGLEECQLKNGAKATILQWTDGDTVWVRAKSDGTCNDHLNSDATKWVRWRLRIHGIDAPECSKAFNDHKYYTCVKDTNYSDNNERYGYESWKWASDNLPYQTVVTLTCDQQTSNGVCVFDNTSDDDADDDQQVYNRFLTYLGYEKNQASYDFSVELARQGLAFSNTKFSSSKRAKICASQKEAIDQKKNIWSLGNSVSAVLNQMGKSKRKGLSNMSKLCNY